MEDSKIYTLNVGKDSVVFEMGDMVWYSQRKGSIVSFDRTTGKARIHDTFVSIYKLRFVNNTPENKIKNTLLDVYSNDLALKKSKQKLSQVLKMSKALAKKRENLKKVGLCEEAITSQLVHEFPEMYS